MPVVATTLVVSVPSVVVLDPGVDSSSAAVTTILGASLGPTKKSRTKKMMNQVQGESLPADRMVKTQCELDAKWIAGSSTVLPHFLNEEKVADTMKKNSILVPYEKTIESKTGESITIQCSTLERTMS